MGRVRLAATALGCAATLAMLLLASPGVRLARADGVEAGAQCDATAARSADSEAEALMEQLQREQLELILDREAEPGIVMLNNRGYNYGPAPTPSLDRVISENTKGSHR